MAMADDKEDANGTDPLDPNDPSVGAITAVCRAFWVALRSQGHRSGKPLSRT